MLGFKGSTQEKRPSWIFRFGGYKASSDKREPDHVDSEGREPPNGQIRELRKQNLNVDTYRLVCIVEH